MDYEETYGSTDGQDRVGVKVKAKDGGCVVVSEECIGIE